MFKDTVVRHVVAEVLAHHIVKTRCGTQITGATITWQKSTPCQRCPKPTDDFRVEISDRPGQPHLPGGPEALHTYCLKALDECGSKTVARKIVRFLGYEPPEKILEQHPELRSKIVYVNAGNRERFDR